MISRCLNHLCNTPINIFQLPISVSVFILFFLESSALCPVCVSEAGCPPGLLHQRRPWAPLRRPSVLEPRDAWILRFPLLLREHILQELPKNGCLGGIFEKSSERKDFTLNGRLGIGAGCRIIHRFVCTGRAHKCFVVGTLARWEQDRWTNVPNAEVRGTRIALLGKSEWY